MSDTAGYELGKEFLTLPSAVDCHEVAHEDVGCSQSTEPKTAAGDLPFSKKLHSSTDYEQVDSLKHTELRLCIICLSPFVLKAGSKTFPLDVLCKSVKIPVKVASDVVQEYLNAPIYCDTCEEKVENAAVILEELENLERLLSVIAQEFKQTIVRTYKDGEFHPAGMIRKSLMQCWARWYVPISVEESSLADQKYQKRLHIAQSESGREIENEAVEVGNESVPSPIPAAEDTEDLIIAVSMNSKTLDPLRRSLRPRKSKQKRWFVDAEDVDATNSAFKRKKSSKESQQSKAKRLRFCPSKTVGNRFQCTKTVPSYKCNICRKAFPSQQNRNSHVMKKHQGISKPYECDCCSRKFEKPSRLVAHKKRWHAPTSGGNNVSDSSVNSSSAGVACTQCSMMFRNELTLSAHILRVHQGISRPYKCPQCDMGFRQKGHLEEHLELHKDSHRFPCEQCGKNFLSERKLRYHKANVHSSGELRFACDKCPKRFSKVYFLENHMYQHTGQKRFICEICGQSYCSNKRLKVHVQRHGSGSKMSEPFQCDKCDKVFSESQSLKAHVLSIHEKKFRFHCEVCGQGTQMLSMLKRHMLCHTEERNYACQVCDQKFKRKPQLVQHMLLHEGRNPYVCKLCGKGFRASEKLKNHEKLHTGEKPFTCELCGKSYALKHYLTNHVNTTHKGLKQQRKPRGDGTKRKGYSTTRIKPSLKEDVVVERNSTSASPTPVITIVASRKPEAVIETAEGVVPVVAPPQASLVDPLYEWVQFGFVPATSSASTTPSNPKDSSLMDT